MGRSGRLRLIERSFAGARGQQRPTIMDETLQAVRGHVQGRDIKRVFIPGRRFHALHLKDLVDIALDLGQLQFRPRPI